MVPSYITTFQIQGKEKYEAPPLPMLPQQEFVSEEVSACSIAELTELVGEGRGAGCLRGLSCCAAGLAGCVVGLSGLIAANWAGLASASIG